MLPKKITEASSPLAARCRIAHSATPHMKGCRVTRMIPIAGDFASGSGFWPTTVGFAAVTAQTTSRNANGIKASARCRTAAPVARWA